jgi:mitochondrial splicing suppressor protein 51
MVAIRSILYPKVILAKDGVTMLKTETVNLYLLGARAESTLPPHIWLQLSHLFPQTPFHIHFIGPDTLPPNREPYTTFLNDRLTFTYDNAMYHDYHEKIGSFDPYRDIYFLFAPGIGHPDSREAWKPSIAKALDTKCAMFITGFDQTDVQTDVKAVEEDHREDFDWILKPTENHFKSLKHDINLQDLTQAICANWGIWGIRGKRYEVTHNQEDD